MSNNAAFAFVKERIDSADFVEEIHQELSSISADHRNLADVRRAIDYFVETRLTDPDLGGAPDDWYNLAVEARRANGIGPYRRILEEGTRRHPNDVDLLCERLQLQYGNGTLAQAEETWQQLTALGVDNVGPYWRYWCYGAIYLARFRHDQKGALELLETGLSRVRFAELAQILRHYRTVYIDGDDQTSPRAVEQTEQLYRKYSGIIEERYKQGLKLGVEDGYILAVKLARLLRERATGTSPEGAAEALDEALHYLEVAERTYTHNPNHPIWEIYIEKAIALMAAHRYADALHVFRSLPEHMLDARLETMARYAANRTGQTFAGPGAIDASYDASSGPAAGQDAALPISLRVDRVRDRVERVEGRLDQVERALQHLISAVTGEGD